MSIKGRIAQTEIIRTMRRTLRLLTPKERQRAYRIAAYSLLSILIDIAGLSLIVPVMIVANNPKVLDEPGIYHDLYGWSGMHTQSQFLMFMAAILLAVFIIKNSITLLAGYAQSKFAYDVGANLARRQYMKYYNLGYRYFKENNSADIVNNILNIPVFFAGGVLVSLINFLVEIMGLILIVILIAVADYRLFLAMMLSLLPAGFLIYSLTKNRLYNIGLKQIKLGVATHTKLYHSIHGLVDVRLTNKENFFLNAYMDEQVRMNDSHKIKHVLNMVPSRALEVIAVMGILVIFTFANLMGDQGESAYKFLVIFAGAAFRLLPSLNRALAAIMGMKGQLSTLDILEQGNLPTTMARVEIHPLDFEQSIEFRNLSFRFDESGNPAVEDLNFTIRKGERIGIIGESGSGKTTLINILLRFLIENSGGIYVDGKKLTEEDIASWRSKVGYVQQHVFLLDASLKENVAFGERHGEIDETRLQMALEQASLMDFVNSLPEKWDTPTGEMGARLSGGQRQRIGIARALYYQSSVLVLDEATSALDNETENSITESLQNLKEDMTVVVVAHRITTLRHCNRIIEMKDGRLIHIWNYPDLVHEKMLK